MRFHHHSVASVATGSGTSVGPQRGINLRMCRALLASAGQMVGKCILYWAGRGAIPMKKGRLAKLMHSWRGRFERSPKKTMSLVFVSAVSGIPPFYVITILSGAFRLRFGSFLTIGACGRLLHFGVIALIPQFGSRLFHIIANH